MDVVNAISTQNLILPSGTAKIGPFEYDVDINGSPTDIAELNQLPIKTVGNTTIYITTWPTCAMDFRPRPTSCAWMGSGPPC